MYMRLRIQIPVHLKVYDINTGDDLTLFDAEAIDILHNVIVDIFTMIRQTQCII